MSLALSLILALLLDYLLAEPKRFHPLVGFGNLANRLERQFNRGLSSVAEVFWPGVWRCCH